MVISTRGVNNFASQLNVLKGEFTIGLVSNTGTPTLERTFVVSDRSWWTWIGGQFLHNQCLLSIRCMKLTWGEILRQRFFSIERDKQLYGASFYGIDTHFPGQEVDQGSQVCYLVLIRLLTFFKLSPAICYDLAASTIKNVNSRDLPSCLLHKLFSSFDENQLCQHEGNWEVAVILQQCDKKKHSCHVWWLSTSVFFDKPTADGNELVAPFFLSRRDISHLCDSMNLTNLCLLLIHVTLLPCVEITMILSFERQNPTFFLVMLDLSNSFQNVADIFQSNSYLIN